MKQAKKQKTRSYTVISSTEFDRIKQALATFSQHKLKGGRKPVGEVSRLTGRAPITVKLISECESLGEYKAAVKKLRNDRRHKVASLSASIDQVLEAKVDEAETETDSNTKPLQGDKVVELLELIYTELKLMRNDNSNRWREAHPAQPEKRGIFNRA